MTWYVRMYVRKLLFISVLVLYSQAAFSIFIHGGGKRVWLPFLVLDFGQC